MKNQEKVVKILIEKGNKLLKSNREFVEFTKDKEADKLMNDIENFPHAFILGSIMDRRTTAEKAWSIPYKISQEIGGFEFQKLSQITEEEFKRIFLGKKLHPRVPEMYKYFYRAIQKIKKDYCGDASKIWKNSKNSAEIVRRLLEFDGVGIKISTMIANILARNFKVKMSDYLGIDISPDLQIRKVFERVGFVKKGVSNEVIIYKAKELNPEYPGVFDYPCWSIGREFCHPKNPKCDECYLNKFCEKNS